jgi:hypothetical protein
MECKVCGCRVAPGNLLCGNKSCYHEWVRMNQLSRKENKERKMYLIFTEIEIRRTEWRP